MNDAHPDPIRSALARYPMPPAVADRHHRHLSGLLADRIGRRLTAAPHDLIGACSQPGGPLAWLRRHRPHYRLLAEHERTALVHWLATHDPRTTPWPAYRPYEALLVNLTPHPVTVHTAHGTLDLPRLAGSAPRLRLTTTTVRHLHVQSIPVPVQQVTPTGPVDPPLPPPLPAVWLVVARVVAEAHPDRRDLLWPQDLLRDADGVVVGCRAFGTHQPPRTRHLPVEPGTRRPGPP